MQPSLPAKARLRRLLPPRPGWLHLLCAPSSFALTLAFAATAIAKLLALHRLRESSGHLFVLLAIDAAVLFGLAAVLAAAEGAWWWSRVATWPVALASAVLALIGALYLGEAGAPLSWQAVELGVERFDDLRGVLVEAWRHLGWLRIAAGMLAMLAFPLGARRLAVRTSSRHADLSRSRCALTVALVGALLALAAPVPHALPLRQLRVDALFATLGQALRGPAVQLRPEFQGYAPPRLLGDAAVQSLAAGDPPNVLLLVMESTRFDATGLAGGNSVTPNLVALAGRGTLAPVTRAVMPHTSKSLFAILCDRLPTLQHTLFELSSDLKVECLAGALGKAGYRTAFFQSALGFFESRPRLVSNLGFQTFFAWEDLHGPPLGYLASDDRSLAAPVLEWIDRQQGQRFFATLLTSGTHHPYRLPADLARGGSALSERERYSRMVGVEDELLGELVNGLDARGLTRRTIIVVVGDHGEGFGEFGVRQHDNDFYEEGLKVPFVIAGPGVPVQRVSGNASVVDVTPSILAALGVSSPAGAGTSVLAGRLPDVPRWFACYYDDACEGFVFGGEKVVRIPRSGGLFEFDLAHDPRESEPLALGTRARAELARFDAILARNRADVRLLGIAYGAVKGLGAWECPEDAACTNPGGTGTFFEPPGR